MSSPDHQSLAGRPRSTAFLLVYALAYAGGVIGYLPLLSLLLPLKIEGVAGEARLDIFTATVIAGSIAASLSNLLFGWLSDAAVAKGRGRRAWVVGGLIATTLSYVLIARATGPVEIVAAVVLFQVALNAALAPLVTIMADEIPDGQKGMAGGLLALANPVASGVSAALVSLGGLGEAARLALVVVAMTVAMTPLLMTRAQLLPLVEEPRAVVALRRGDLVVAWVARLLTQISGVVLQLYLLYYFESISPVADRTKLAGWVGPLLMLSYFIALPVAVLAGRLSDRLDQRKPFLIGAAMLSALGLIGMASAHSWTQGAIAFSLSAVGTGVLMPLQIGFSMQLLPDPRHRGRDQGLLNLTNTLPSLLGPLLTWLLATPRDFHVLMLALAALSLCGGFAILGVRGRR